MRNNQDGFPTCQPQGKQVLAGTNGTGQLADACIIVQNDASNRLTRHD
jgi:hypothetical protein